MKPHWIEEIRDTPAEKPAYRVTKDACGEVALQTVGGKGESENNWNLF
jgi:hypothetical protein